MSHSSLGPGNKVY